MYLFAMLPPLQAHPVLAKLSAEMLAEVARKAKLVVVKDGDFVIRQGEAADAFFIITKVSLKIANVFYTN